MSITKTSCRVKSEPPHTKPEPPPSYRPRNPPFTLGSMTKLLLATLAALALVACGGDGLPGERLTDAGTGGLASTGGATSTGGAGAGGSSTGGATGGEHATGGSAATGGSTGGATGGAAATGGALGTGGAGTGGAAVVAMCSAGVIAQTCRATIHGGWATLRFTADGQRCGTCSGSAGNSKQDACMTKADDVLVSGSAVPPKVDVLCVDSCDKCPVVKCYSTGGDWGTEYPCP